MRAFLISGVPGAGKTTVCRALAHRLPSAAHIEGDVLSFEFVVSGLAVPADVPEWNRQMALRRRNIGLLAKSFAADGFTPVMDDVVVSQESLAPYLDLGLDLVFVVLAPRLDIVEERDRARDKQVFEAWRHLDEELRGGLSDVGVWIDSSDQDVDETVDAVLASVE